MQQSALCLIVKNERLDIAEWIAHHVGIGVDRLIIYDDRSDDGTAEWLDKLAEHFPIDVIHWETEEKERQNAAYRDCLARFGADFAWIGFLDADEFLIPPAGASLPQLLERHNSHDAFSINWLIFGTSGVADTNGRLVMETFTHRADVQFNDNRHVKSFVRPSKVQRVLNAHYFVGPAQWADVMGQAINWGDPLGVVKDGGAVLGDWRIHHYILRSDAHWQRRMLRGRANTSATRTQEFFIHHDRNEVLDETALPYAAKARKTLQSKGLLTHAAPNEALAREVLAATPATDKARTSVARNIRLHLDEINYYGVRGWAQDDAVTDLNATLQLQFLVDGQLAAQVDCSQFRADVEKAGYRGSSGFDFVLPAAVFNGADHDLTVQTLDGRSVVIHLKQGAILKLSFNDKWRPKFIGNVDGFRGGTLRGWLLREEENGTKVGNSMLAVTCDDAVIGYTHANKLRADVGRAHSADAYCGFEFVVPHEFRANDPQTFHVKVTPYDIELRGSPITHSFPDSDQNATWMDDGYDAWARRYLEILRRRVEAMREENTAQTAIGVNNKAGVSIICPVYRPDLGDFNEAVESVIQQTYQDWELILVDDGSQMPELSAHMEAFGRRDSRIKIIRQDENSGIANATNRALSEARGKWVAFLDHDDVLVDVALEVMVKKAGASNALLLYSDEDKIADGHFSDPAFKPGWNYRMMLSANYICHFVMVDRHTLHQVGNFSSAYNGAQDHDILLRLSEIIPASQIQHVPEILYHWRVSATSTAGGAGAKPYAIAAGQRAIADHLQRRKTPATIDNIADMTWYRVNWQFTAEPKVCIIIPFKDQVKITRECLDRIVGMTSYRNYEVILVDNGSVTDEANRFCRDAAEHAHVQVIRDDGPFNYSRLNNRAARTTDAEFLVLMNNDLHVRDSNWLRVLVDEALADKDVGIVGGKFLYPDGTVQHAGVVLGVGGVACHINGGIREHDPGYGGRALFAQELSAVTAACLLVSAKLYWTVGGLDEHNLAVAFNDIDLCLKARELGYKVIWTPAFVAIHHESLSRGADNGDSAKQDRFCREAQYMQQRWGHALMMDEFYSPFFDLDSETAFCDLTNPYRLSDRSIPLPPVRATKWIHG